MLSFRHALMIATLAVVLVGANTAVAGRRHHGSHGGPEPCPPSAPCEPVMVEKTILVPQMTMEKRTVCVTEYRCEPRQETVTICRLVPNVTTTKKIVTDMVPQMRTRIEKCMIRKPVQREVTCEVVVNVPHVEKRESTRMVTRCVPVKETRIVCEDQGQFEERVVELPACVEDECGGCGRRGWRRRGGCGCATIDCTLVSDEKSAGSPVQKPAQTVQKVWVPKMVERKEEVVVYRTECVPEKCVYNVVVCRPEKRTVKRYVTDYVEEPGERRVAYYECVPKQREVACHHVTYKKVTEERVLTRMIRIPYTVEKEVNVPVCTMVEKRVMCKVPACSAAGAPCRGCR